jgi:thiamine biosynthesis protein ThiI
VHFHSFPFTEKASYYNAIALAKKLTRFQYSTKLYLVPLTPVQKAIITSAPTKLRLILYRRAMFRIAEMIAKKEQAKALVTGESLGQVASQTLENITAISEVVTLPVLRPLIAFNKESIIEQAKALDTFTTSIEPYDDCCSYLVPPNPETKAKLPEVQAAEAGIANLDTYLNESLRQAEIKTFQFPNPEKENSS